MRNVYYLKLVYIKLKLCFLLQTSRFGYFVDKKSCVFNSYKERKIYISGQLVLRYLSNPYTSPDKLGLIILIN